MENKLNLLAIFVVILLTLNLAFAQTTSLEDLIKKLQETLQTLSTATSATTLTPELKKPPPVSESIPEPIPCFLPTLKPGDQNENVRILQELLKTDPSLYPEGLITGYYGPATKRAIERLQQRFGLQPTGIVDEQTSRILFPCPEELKLKVISPNGGEVWRKGNTYEIKWDIFYKDFEPPLSILPLILKIYPDLYINIALKKAGMDFYHSSIAVGVRPFSRSYKWTIPGSIPDGDDYKVEITLLRGGTFPPPPYDFERETNLPPGMPFRIIAQDESDGVFTITGEKIPPPGNIEKVLELLRNIEKQLEEVIRLLEEIAGQFQ